MGALPENWSWLIYRHKLIETNTTRQNKKCWVIPIK